MDHPGRSAGYRASRAIDHHNRRTRMNSSRSDCFDLAAPVKAVRHPEWLHGASCCQPALEAHTPLKLPSCGVYDGGQDLER
jgi:hypothetical protein